MTGVVPRQPVAERGAIVSLVGQQFPWRGKGFGKGTAALPSKHWPPLRAKGGLCGPSPRGLWLCSRRGLCPGPGLAPLFTPRRTVDLNGGAIDSVLVRCADNLA